ncbi:hypothetical protein Y1Q_0005306 [Alligator mississippiensis]|uniref:Uncharacterized protein n=1 Tax=Alligator mississippiensis TaxID=8496 RepID=A0A151MTC2_ALLMI|nr:hypothetical protein Y1Q_0005306 [Alligator mississippiensis]
MVVCCSTFKGCNEDYNCTKTVESLSAWNDSKGNSHQLVDLLLVAPTWKMHSQLIMTQIQKIHKVHQVQFPVNHRHGVQQDVSGDNKESQRQ